MKDKDKGRQGREETKAALPVAGIKAGERSSQSHPAPRLCAWAKIATTKRS